MYILLAEANDRRKKGSLKATSVVDLQLLLMNTKPVLVDGSVATKEAEDVGTHRHANNIRDALPVSADEEARPLIRHPPSAAVSTPGLGAATGGLSSAAEVLFYSAVSAIPFLMLGTVITGESSAWPVVMSGVYDRLGGDEGGLFWPWLASVAWMETALAGSLVWCTERNSGLTTSIVGVLKGVVAVLLGLVFMTGPSGGKVTPMNLMGIGMVLCGGTWYSVLQCKGK